MWKVKEKNKDHCLVPMISHTGISIVTWWVNPPLWLRHPIWEQLFESQLLCFQFRTLQMPLGKHLMVSHVLEPLPSMWETRLTFQDSGFHWLLWKLVERASGWKIFSLSFSASLLFFLSNPSVLYIHNLLRRVCKLRNSGSNKCCKGNKGKYYNMEWLGWR